MNEITEELLKIEDMNKSLEQIKEKISPITILGLSDVLKSCVLNMVEEETKKQTVFLTYNELKAQNIYKYARNLNKEITYIPKKDIVTYEYDAENMDIFYQRQEALNKMYNNEANLIVLSIETMMQNIMSKKTMQNNILKIIVANNYDIEEIKEKLVKMGYERYDLVETKGTYSVRGDILDIAISNKIGVRIEFFGDEVDQIRYFDMASQRSTENINQIKIYPLTEQIDEKPNGILSEYFAEDAIIIFDEISKIDIRSNNILNDNKYIIKELIEKEKNVPYILENMYSIEYIEKKLEKFQKIYVEEQDIIQNRENVNFISYDKVKEIENTFSKITKQEKENKTYKPRKKHSKEFNEGEKVVFNDLKIR